MDLPRATRASSSERDIVHRRDVWLFIYDTWKWIDAFENHGYIEVVCYIKYISYRAQYTYIWIKQKFIHLSYLFKYV